MLTPRSLVVAINGFVDRAIGAADLPVTLREKLLREQLQSAIQMAPAMLAATVIVSTVFVVMSLGASTFPVVLGLIVSVNIAYFLHAVLAMRGLGEVPVATLAARTSMFALLEGLLWAAILALLPTKGAPALLNAQLIGAGGLFCVSMMSLVNYPQAMGALVIPIAVGTLAALIGAGGTSNMVMVALMLTGLTFVMVTITFNHAAAFVAFRASEKLVQEKGEIIGLLLGEFEQTTSDWIWGIDADGRTNRISSGFTDTTGVSEEALLGADFVYFLRCVAPPNDPVVAEIERDVLARRTFQDVELRVVASGQECWWSLTGKPAFDETGAYLGYLGTGSDVTERKMADMRITLLAHHDPMTGLLNRTKFTEQLSLSVARLERYGTPFALMFLDLDAFKSVNDRLGHLAGDRVLTEMSRRISAHMHEGDLVARLGGDEFAVILPNQSDVTAIQDLAGRLIAAAREPISVDGQIAQVGMSIGIALAPTDGTRPEQLLRNADLALYRAKGDGRSVYRFFDDRMTSELAARATMEAELRLALERDELVLHYQPQVDADTGEPTGFEALIRWNHPERGLVSPAEFIAVAEQSGLMGAIGDWTLETACRAAALWPEHLTVAVNLSPSHFRQSDIGLVLKGVLARVGLDPQRLEVEITEALMLEDAEAVVAKLHEIKALGVTVALDDFGTGYSSLSYLLKFPFDKIKIDRSFVEASARDSVARDILRAIAALGKTLKISITAEGVETVEQAKFLSEIACHQLQGFYFARPLDAADLPHYLLSHVQHRVASAAPARRSKAS